LFKFLTLYIIVSNYSGGKFIEVGEKIRLPDDVTIGYIIEHLLNKNLSVVNEFHSHLEPMKFIKTDKLAEQVSAFVLFQKIKIDKKKNRMVLADDYNYYL